MTVVSALSGQYSGSSPHDYLETMTQLFSICSCLSAHSAEGCIILSGNYWVR